MSFKIKGGSHQAKCHLVKWHALEARHSNSLKNQTATLNNLVQFSQIQLFFSTGIVSIKKKKTTTTTNEQKHTKSPDRGFLANKNIF